MYIIRFLAKKDIQSNAFFGYNRGFELSVSPLPE